MEFNYVFVYHLITYCANENREAPYWELITIIRKQSQFLPVVNKLQWA